MRRFILMAAGLILLGACRETTSPPETQPAGSSPVPELGAGTLQNQAAISPQLWAVVSLNGALLRKSGVLGAQRLGRGSYEVRFNRDVTGCLYVATARQTYPQAILAFTASGHLHKNGVYVETRAQTGGLVDGNFSVAVSCGSPQGISGVVVGYTGNLVRASAGVRVVPLPHSPGRFIVKFPNPVDGCAFIATVGDPGNARVVQPAYVFTARETNIRDVRVETRNFGLGFQSGVPFHLAIVCPTTPDSRFAVVRASGSSQRASPSTSSSRPAVGKYVVSSNRRLIDCAALATRGSVGTAFPIAPGTVENIAPPTSMSAAFQVRKPLVVAGAPTDLDFHAAIIC